MKDHKYPSFLDSFQNFFFFCIENQIFIPHLLFSPLDNFDGRTQLLKSHLTLSFKAYAKLIETLIFKEQPN